ncbi:hypothetical protein IQ07DRAFT_126496 [Pyrenochaeta sp. DS3sAY3a]|nr:hypothetical protein IQ07DRAFT_126496 [Pyrenochaeta sp. DS3sAY3a]
MSLLRRLSHALDSTRDVHFTNTLALTSSLRTGPMAWAYFGVKKRNEPITHRGSLAFGLASAVHLLGSTCTCICTKIAGCLAIRHVGVKYSSFRIGSPRYIGLLTIADRQRSNSGGHETVHLKVTRCAWRTWTSWRLASGWQPQHSACNPGICQAGSA